VLYLLGKVLYLSAKYITDSNNDPAINFARFSRLLVDANRVLEADSIFKDVAENGELVALNINIDAAEKQKRLDICHIPYHKMLASTVKQNCITGRFLSNLSLNSPLRLLLTYDRKDRRLSIVDSYLHTPLQTFGRRSTNPGCGGGGTH